MTGGAEAPSHTAGRGSFCAELGRTLLEKVCQRRERTLEERE